MPTTTTNAVMIAFFDRLLSNITPTANFTEVASAPLANLKTTRLIDQTKTPDLTDQRQLVWDLGVATEFNIFALIGSNAALTATGKLEAADNSGFTVNKVETSSLSVALFDTSLGFDIDSPGPVHGRTILFILPQSWTKRYVRYRQSDPGNSDGFMAWSTACIGLGWQPEIGFDGDSFRRGVILSSGVRGSERLLRPMEFTFPALSRDDMHDLKSIVNLVKTTRRMLVIPEPLTPETWLHDALWCTLSSMPSSPEPVARSGYSDRHYRWTLSFLEAER